MEYQPRIPPYTQWLNRCRTCDVHQMLQRRNQQQVLCLNVYPRCTILPRSLLLTKKTTEYKDLLFIIISSNDIIVRSVIIIIIVTLLPAFSLIVGVVTVTVVKSLPGYKINAKELINLICNAFCFCRYSLCFGNGP